MGTIAGREKTHLWIIDKKELQEKSEAMSRFYYKILITTISILDGFSSVKAGVIEPIEEGNENQGCVGSVKLLDYQKKVLTTFNKDTDKPEKLNYNGTVEILRVQGNCCFIAKERRRRGKILRLEQPIDYEPTWNMENIVFMEMNECPSVMGSAEIAAIVVVVVLVVLVGGAFFY